MAVKLLCHFDGTNGSTSFTDTWGGHTLTPSGVTVSTTSPKFGTGSGSFTSSSAAYIDTNNTVDFNLGAGRFTTEGWAYFTVAPSGVQAVVSQWGGDLGWFFGMNGGWLTFYYSTTGVDSNYVGNPYSPPLNTWVHLAADRDASNVLRVYVNGAVLASATVAVTIHAPTTGGHCIIGNSNTAAMGFPGRLDEVRVDVGTAQYGGAFTVPVAPFPDPAQSSGAQVRVMVMA